MADITLEYTTKANPNPVTVQTSLWVTTLWERKFNRKSSDLATGVGMEDLLFMAYEASKEAGIVVPVVFDDFIKSLVSLDYVSSEPTNPTEPAPSGDN